MDNSQNKTFLVEDENGQTKEAQTISSISIEGRKYLIYSIKASDSMSMVCASKIIKNDSGMDTLADIEEGEDKEKIRKFIESLSK